MAEIGCLSGGHKLQEKYLTMSFLQRFTRRDLGFAVLTGLITGTIGWRIFEFLKTPEFYNIPWSLLIVVVPVLWILGVLLGYLLGQWLDFFNQFGKFAAIGFTNFAVTAGGLNILLSITNYASGIGYLVIFSIAFIVNVIIASLVVNYIHPVAGMNAHQWANIGTVAGSAIGLIFSFVGFKLTVFRQ